MKDNSVIITLAVLAVVALIIGGNIARNMYITSVSMKYGYEQVMIKGLSRPVWQKIGDGDER